jgi:hypothetical protein
MAYMLREEQKIAKYFVIISSYVEEDRNWIRYKGTNVHGPPPPINVYRIKYLGIDKTDSVTEPQLLSLSKLLKG